MKLKEEGLIFIIIAILIIVAVILTNNLSPETLMSPAGCTADSLDPACLTSPLTP